MLLSLSIIGVFVTKKIGDVFFPEKMDILYLQLGMVGIYTLSQVYNLANSLYNLKNWCCSFFENTQTKILLINDGHERHECDVNHMSVYVNSLSNYDVILYKEQTPSANKYKYNILRLDETTYVNCMLKKQTIQVNKNEFLFVQILYKDNTYVVDFGVNNYYIEGNKLFDKPFIKWFLNASYGVLLDDNTDYICNFMDKNINIISLNSSQYVVIEKDNYSLRL